MKRKQYTFEEFAGAMLDHDEIPRERNGRKLTLDQRFEIGDVTRKQMLHFWKWSKAHGNDGVPSILHAMRYQVNPK